MMGTRGLRVLLVCVVFAVVAGSAAVAHAEWALPDQRLTTNDQPQVTPDISGDWMAFQDWRDPVNYGDDEDPDQLYEIRAINLKTMTEKKITPSKTAMWEPAIAGNYVVWPDYGNGSTTMGLWYHNLKTGTHKKLPVKTGHITDVEISGHRVVYTYDRDIYTYNLWTGKHVKVTSGDKSHSPDISGTKIVYVYVTGTLNFDIRCYDILTGVTKQLTSDAAHNVGDPAISGDNVVWEDGRNGLLNDDIYLYNLKANTETRLTYDSDYQTDPAISGNYVVWQDERHGNAEVYLYDLVTNTPHRMTTQAADQSRPAISGSRIVYQDSRNGLADLYQTRVARPIISAAGPAAIDSGTQPYITGLLASGNGVYLAGKWVELESSTDNKNWKIVSAAQTTGTGAFSLISPPFTTRRYFRVFYTGFSALPTPEYPYPSGYSNTVLVRARIGFTSAPKFGDYSQTYGRTYKVWGYFKPKHSAGSKQIKVRAYRWNGSSYVYKKTYYTKVSNPSGSDYSKYTGYIRLPSKGTWRLRAYHAADSNNAKSFSVYRSVKVK